MWDFEFDAVSQGDLQPRRLGEQSKLVAEKFILAPFKTRAGRLWRGAIGCKSLQPGIEGHMFWLVCRDHLRLHKQAGLESRTVGIQRLVIFAVHKDIGSRLAFGEYSHR